MKKINYKYNEAQMLSDLKEYIDSTYQEHYAQNKYQATEFVIDAGHGLGFCIGNILKYSQRYGKKDGYNKKDLMKVLHYTIIALSIDEEPREEPTLLEQSDYGEGIIEEGVFNGTKISELEIR